LMVDEYVCYPIFVVKSEVKPVRDCFKWRTLVFRCLLLLKWL